MYRQYENPHVLEDMLAELKMELQNEKDEDTIINLQIEIAELNDRIMAENSSIRRWKNEGITDLCFSKRYIRRLQ